MNTFTYQVVKCAAAAFDVAEPIAEIGSLRYDLPGQAEDLRRLFPERPYIGCDISAGPGVDRVEDITQLSFKDGEVGTVLCLHILEHVWDVFAAARQIRRVVNDGGMAIIVCPFNLHIHRFPKDYWRFTDDCMRKLMEGFPYVVVGRRGYSPLPSDVFAIGFNRTTFPDFDERCANFRQCLAQSAYDPSTLGMRLRMWIGSGLFRKRNFQSFLSRNELALDFVRPG